MPKKLKELEVYILAEHLSNQIWDIVKKWNYFERDTIGKQLVRAVDSIGANIAECHGRYHYIVLLLHSVITKNLNSDYKPPITNN